LWAAARGNQLTHAAAVGNEGGCLLLVGPAGAGKSTTALACAQAGVGFLADDYCLLTPEPRVTAWSVFSTAKLASDSFEFLGLDGAATGQEKAVLYLGETASDALLPAAPVAGILIPVLARRPETVLRDASPFDALAAVGPSTLLQLQGSAESRLAMLSSLVQSVPSYFLELSRSPEAAVDVIGGVLGRTPSARRAPSRA
jgi:hypothetical protein